MIRSAVQRLQNLAWYACAGSVLVSLWVVFLFFSHAARVVETFRDARIEIFRGMRSWRLSSELGKHPLALQKHMLDLENVFVFKLFGVPITSHRVHATMMSILVGMLFTLMVPIVVTKK